MAYSESDFLHDLSDLLNNRLDQITKITRVTHAHESTVLEQTAFHMAIPLLYAHWEGFVKEALQNYLRFIQERAIPQRMIEPAVLAYSWTPDARRLAANLSFESQVRIVERALAALSGVVQFGKDELEINTKGNLKFETLEDLFKWLSLDIDTVRGRKAQVNTLVNRRNMIAHGGRPQSVEVEEVDRLAQLVVDLMKDVEGAVSSAVADQTYMRVEARA